MQSEPAVAAGFDWHPINAGVRKFASRYAHGGRMHRARVDQSIPRYGNGSIWRPQIGIGDMRVEVSAPVIVEVIIRNVRDIHDARIADVHVTEIAAAHAIPRVERLTPPKRAPSEAAAKTKSEVDAPSRAAKPCHQGWRVIRTHVVRSRHPSPIALVIDPAAIVEGSESPGRVVYPGPAPGIDPHPMAVVIGSPSRRYGRNPNRPVRIDHAPLTIVVKILVSDRVTRNIAG